MPNRNAEPGQGITEYAVILALVLIAIIGLAVTFGDDLRQMFDNSGSSTPATMNAPLAPSAPDGGRAAPATK